MFVWQNDNMNLFDNIFWFAPASVAAILQVLRYIQAIFCHTGGGDCQTKHASSLVCVVKKQRIYFRQSIKRLLWIALRRLLKRDHIF